MALHDPLWQRVQGQARGRIPRWQSAAYGVLSSRDAAIADPGSKLSRARSARRRDAACAAAFGGAHGSRHGRLRTACVAFFAGFLPECD